MRTIIFAALSAFTLSVNLANAQEDYPRPPLEAYGALPQISDAEISPDGSKVATIVNFEGGTRVVVFDLQGSEPIQLGVQNMKADSVSFYDNENVIFRARDTKSTFGFRGEFEYSGAFTINLKTTETQQLLRRTDNLHPAQSGLGRIVGRGKKSGEVLMPAYVGGGVSEATYDLLRVQLESPRGRRFVPGSANTKDWFVGGAGEVLARVQYDNKKDRLSVQTYENRKWTTILEEETDIPWAYNGVMLDETGLVYVQENDDGHQLMSLQFDGTTIGPILPPNGREIEAVYSDDNRKILGIRYAGVEPDYAFLDAALQKSFDLISEAFPAATIYIDSWTDDRTTILYHLFDFSLGDVWITHHVPTNDVKLVAKRRPDIPIEAVAPMMSIQYQGQDDLTIQAILTVPPNFVPGEAEPNPAIVLPHGGPTGYDAFDFDWMAQFFANRGYLVIQPNFRGSTGFGKEFEDAGRGEWGGKMQSDLTDGVNALVKAGYVDPNNVCIVGASYGGYAALAGAVFTPDLYRCVIAIAPVSDLNRMLQSEKRDHGKDHWVVSYWEGIMADGEARRKKLQSISPANYAENAKAPILLIHGDDDTVVPYAQSTRMRNALNRAGKPVELVKLKGEDHWLSVADTRMQTLRAMDEFLATHMPIAD